MRSQHWHEWYEHSDESESGRLFYRARIHDGVIRLELKFTRRADDYEEQETISREQMETFFEVVSNKVQRRRAPLKQKQFVQALLDKTWTVYRPDDEARAAARNRL